MLVPYWDVGYSNCRTFDREPTVPWQSKNLESRNVGCYPKANHIISYTCWSPENTKIEGDVTGHPKHYKCFQAFAFHERSDTKHCTGLYGQHKEVVGI